MEKPEWLTGYKEVEPKTDQQRRDESIITMLRGIRAMVEVLGDYDGGFLWLQETR